MIGERVPNLPQSKLNILNGLVMAVQVDYSYALSLPGP